MLISLTKLCKIMDDFGRDDSERSDLVEWILYLQFFAVTQHTECIFDDVHFVAHIAQLTIE